MVINRWDPFGEMVSLRDAMDRLVRDSFVRAGGGAPTSESFPLDVGETDDGYVVRAYLPGVSPECADVSVHGGVLTIRVELPENDEPDVRSWIMRERHAGTLERGVRLPMAVDVEAAQASCEGGVLRILLPRAESVRPRRIPVSGSTTVSSAPGQEDVRREDVVAEASDMSFPASDPPSWNPASPGGGAQG